MKLLQSAILACILSGSLAAQYRDPAAPSQKPPVIARVSLVTPKFVLDFAPMHHFTLSAGFWFRPEWWTSTSGDWLKFNPVPRLNPRFTFEPRYFFNQQSRKRNGKRTDFYSGWYVGIPFYIEFPRQRYHLGSTFGFQCTFGRRWYWNIESGPGFTLEEGGFRFTGSGDISLGIVLN